MKNFNTYFYIALLAVVPTLLVWMPFALRLETIMGIPASTTGMQTVMANFDGPLYVVVAKSFYNLEYISQNYSFPLPLEYYAAHFPLYPLTIKLFSFATGHAWGMLLSTLFATVIANYFFYKLARVKLNKQKALWLTAIFSFFPARWLIVKSVGSPEPLFIGSILASIYYFNDKKYWKSGIWGAVAQLTKSPGILLFIALGIAVAAKNFSKLSKPNSSIRKWIASFKLKAFPVLLIPISLLGLFALYSIKFNDFFAYFNSGDNIHLFFPPFQIFDYTQSWVGTFWLEDVIFVYVLGAIGISKLIKEKMFTEAIFVFIFFATIIFVSHRDVLRYSLPIMPFILLAFGEELNKKYLKYAILFLIFPIYFFAVSYISANTMPIPDWTNLL